MATKYYKIDRGLHDAAIAERASKGLKPLPLQQRLILQALTLIDRPATGSEIIDYAVKNLGLQTRQQYNVLYAWYARSNEEYGVILTSGAVQPKITIEEVQAVAEGMNMTSDEIAWPDQAEQPVKAEGAKRAQKRHAA